MGDRPVGGLAIFPADTVSVTALPHARNARFCVLMASDANTLVLSDAQQTCSKGERPDSSDMVLLLSYV